MALKDLLSGPAGLSGGEPALRQRYQVGGAGCMVPWRTWFHGGKGGFPEGS